MRDVLGWRCKFGVIGPSTNTIVQPDFEMMRPIGVTNHYRGIFTPNAMAVSNDTFMAGTQLIGENVLDAVRNVVTCEPDYLVMGMSAVTFYGGAARRRCVPGKGRDRGRPRYQHRVAFLTAALKAYGDVKRIAFLSPYYPVANAEVRRYFTESGFEVVRDMYLECKSWTANAEVHAGHAARPAHQEHGDGNDVDAIIEIGTNLSMVRSPPRPSCGSANPSSPSILLLYRHALRHNKIMDKIPGLDCSKSFGRSALHPHAGALEPRQHLVAEIRHLVEKVDEGQPDAVHAGLADGGKLFGDACRACRHTGSRRRRLRRNTGAWRHTPRAAWFAVSCSCSPACRR